MSSALWSDVLAGLLGIIISSGVILLQCRTLITASSGSTELVDPKQD